MSNGHTIIKRRRSLSPQEKAVIDVMETCRDLGWWIAVLKGAELKGLVIGTPDYIKSLATPGVREYLIFDPEPEH